MKISRRKLKSLIESVLNEVENKPVSYKSADQERLEKELADLNEKALAAIKDEPVKIKVRDSIKKLMGKVDKAEFIAAKQIALNVYAGELGDVDTTLKGTLQGYDKQAKKIIINLEKLNSAESEKEAGKAVSKETQVKKKKGLSTSAKDKVKKIQEIIGASADGSWGPKTTTAWKTWIVSDSVKNVLKGGHNINDASLTPDYLESNKGKAAVIAKKAGYSADLDGVLSFVMMLATQISADVDDEDYGEIADRVTDPNYEGPVGDGRYKAGGKIYKTVKEAEAAIKSDSDYGNISDRTTDPNYEGFVGDGRYKVDGKIYDSFAEALKSGALKDGLKETKIRRMIRQIILKNVRTV